MKLEAYLGDIAVQVPGQCNKEIHNLFAGGGFCLQFEKNATSMKHNKGKLKKTRYACICTFWSFRFQMTLNFYLLT